MNLSKKELEFLAAWAREEWEPACYGLPAHRLQLSHGVSGASLVGLIKAWTIAERKLDKEILQVSANAEPNWPWATMEEFRIRLDEAGRSKSHRHARVG